MYYFINHFYANFHLIKVSKNKMSFLNSKHNQMRSPSLLSGPKIRNAYFEVSNRKMLLHRPPLKSDFKGVIKVTFFDLKPQSRIYPFLFQIK